jgi:VWFA-related protein
MVSAACLFGQEALYTLKVEVPWVTVDVTVTDHSGRSVGNLKSSDFEVFENGVPQKIDAFAPVTMPYNILLLFDRSGSTEHKWYFMLKAVAGFIENLRPQDRIAIDSFDFGFAPIAPWTSRRDLSLTALSDLVRPRNVGGTAFYSALETVLHKEFKTIAGRRAVVVLTDGRDTSLYKQIIAHNRMVSIATEHGFQKTLKAAREQHVPIYFIAMNTDLNYEPNVSGGDEYRNLDILFPESTIPDDYLKEVRTGMEQLAGVSGGRVLYPKNSDEIVPLYREIGRELGTAYSLAYISNDSKSDGTLRRIEVRATDASLHLSQSRTSYVANK